MKPDEADLSRLQDALGSKYHVLRWIGGGGMAQVYLARNRATGGLFAVKVLAAHLCDEEALVARFLQEARTSAALSGHPKIVSIFDVGQHGETHYILMQYVEGEDLKAYLKRRGKLPAAEAAGIVEQIAEALVFAHSRRVVHRDLKPSNIKVQNTGRVVVLDFGIAKAGDAPSQLTTAGQRVGTPHYMSPEHFSSGTCDARSDLYSLGVVFFELLTGRRPFDADTIQEIELAHRTAPPPSPRDFEPAVPETYARIVLRLLAKAPEDRYQDADELVADLRQAAGGGAWEAALASGAPAAPEPAVKEAPPAAEPAPGVKSGRGRAIAAGVAVALLLAVAAGLYLRSTDGSAEESAAVPTAIAATVVTNTAYKAFCDETGHPYPEPPPSDPNYFYARPEAPVLNVTYRDAAAFAKWSGGRLPTAEEVDGDRAAPGGEAAVEWTATPFNPSAADIETFRKLAGADPHGDWYAIRGEAPLAGLPSEAPPRGIAVGFRVIQEKP